MDALSVEELALILYVRRKKLKLKKKKKLWIHPFIADRSQSGLFRKLYTDLRQYPRKFFNCIRMSISSFDELLSLFKNQLMKQDTILRKAISPEEKLFVTLRYFATGCTFMDIYYDFRIGHRTICTIIREVCDVICQHQEQFIPTPSTKEEWEKIARGFESSANFPNCIGAIDGKHIRLIKPTDTGSLYYNYKHFFSMVLLGICDASYNFVYIDVGAYGKSSDSAVFKDTTLYNKFISRTLNLPPPRPLKENGENIPYVLLGDEAFALNENLMRPYGGHSLSYKKKIYNYRLSRGRRYIECTFGILSNKWRIFHRPINVKIDLAKKIVKSCCILHNFVGSRDGYSLEDTKTVTGYEPVTERDRGRGGRTAIAIRDKLAEYFVTDNPLTWQDNFV